MDHFSAPINIRWADIDANRHLRHSVYYDFAAAMRMNLLNERGLTSAKLQEFQLGPILFREEAIFKREIKLEDKIMLDVHIIRSTENYSRWALRHHFVKEDGTIGAVVTVEGAWMDLIRRKLALPNEFVQSIFAGFPKSSDFEWVVKPNK